MLKKKIVAVAMSGGVDSSLAAVLLQQQGFEVFGVTMKLWKHDDSAETSKGKQSRSPDKAIESAKAVCEKHSMEHHVLDLSAQFRDKVVANFIDEYKSGRTPNPCVVCNAVIKWNALYENIKGLGAECIATGHYARIEYGRKYNRYELRKGLDQKRDQSYFLWGLKQDDLKRSIFPLGQITKRRTRELAKQFDIPTARAPESREICFIPDDDYRKFMTDVACTSSEPGDFLDENGKVVGQHKGVTMYTVGQRKGLGVALGYPAYVRAIDVEKNVIHLGREEALEATEFIIENVNWVSVPKRVASITGQVKIRYSATPVEATVTPRDDDTCLVKLGEAVKAITPGQSAVIYSQDVVNAGGIIARVVK